MADLEGDLSRIRMICSRFPEAEEGVIQGRPLFRVRRRWFAIFNGQDASYRKRWDGFEKTLHFMTDSVRRPELETDSRFRVSPHHGFRGWFALDLSGEVLDWFEIDDLLESAYRSVAGMELVSEMDRDNP